MYVVTCMHLNTYTHTNVVIIITIIKEREICTFVEQMKQFNNVQTYCFSFSKLIDVIVWELVCSVGLCWVAKVDLELPFSQALPSRVLGLQVCATMPGLYSAEDWTLDFVYISPRCTFLWCNYKWVIRREWTIYPGPWNSSHLGNSWGIKWFDWTI